MQAWPRSVRTDLGTGKWGCEQTGLSAETRGTSSVNEGDACWLQRRVAAWWKKHDTRWLRSPLRLRHQTRQHRFSFSKKKKKKKILRKKVHWTIVLFWPAERANECSLLGLKSNLHSKLSILLIKQHLMNKLQISTKLSGWKLPSRQIQILFQLRLKL